MSSLEQNTIYEAAEEADKRVSSSTEDIAIEQLEEIKKLESTITNSLQHYKELGGDRSTEVMSYYTEIQLSDAHTPEAMLRQIKSEFDLIDQSEDLADVHRLRSVTGSTIADLKEMKVDLGFAAKSAATLELKAQRSYETYLGSYDFNPSNVAESVQTIGESIGEMPNTEKLSNYEASYDFLLEEIRQAKNADRYFHAKLSFKMITGGMNLEDIKGDISRALERIATLSETDPEAAKQALMLRFKPALDMFKIGIDALQTALFTPEEAFSEMNHLPSDDVEDLSSNGLLSENEMSVILGLILHGSKNPTFTEQLFDAENAYHYYTGKSAEDYNHIDGLVVGVGKGVGGLPTFIGNAIGDPEGTILGLYNMGAAMFKPSTYANIKNVLDYGWGNTSPQEKTMLIGLIAGEILGAKGAGALGSHLKNSQLGQKLASYTRGAGLISSSAKIAQMVSPILTKFPRLARYGATAGGVVKGLVNQSRKVGSCLSCVSEAGKEVVKGVERQKRDAVTIFLEDAHGVIGDLQIAVDNAAMLGLTVDDVKQLNQSRSLIEGQLI
ncbi:MAG: hypothetical protein ACI9QC_000336 [Oceanicoccus sp.]|jgi:hypothetical protein